MVFEKKKKRSRIVKFGKDDWYETMSGVKFPIKSKPMVWSDLYVEFQEDLAKINKAEKDRVKSITTDGSFDMEEYSEIVNSYIEDFYNIVKIITEFNGYDIDEEFIKANMGIDDPVWYMQSLSVGYPIYSIDDLTVKKKK